MMEERLAEMERIIDELLTRAQEGDFSDESRTEAIDALSNLFPAQ